MLKKCSKLSGNGLTWIELAWNCLKLSQMVAYGPRWFNMVQDGLKWSRKVHEGPRFREARLMYWKQYILHMYGLSAEGAKASVKKRRHLTILPISMVYFFSLIFSFLCVQIFQYSQEDRFFQMGHCAISPSWMALFLSVLR